MRQSRFSHSFVFAIVIVFTTACGGGSQKKAETDSIANPDSVIVNSMPATNTIITTPQGMMIATFKVADFDKWIPGYEGHDSVRLASQIHSYVIGRGLMDSNMVMVAVKVDDMAKAKAFAKDPGLKKEMQKGGVKGTPVFSYVTMTFQDTAIVHTAIRSRSVFQVKDWDTWQKAFEEGKQDRLNNGIIVRAYGHDADDNHKVVVVTALMDTAKASAYWKSDMLKSRMEAAGVIGMPERYMFRIVRRY
ncbi:hypothetical protein ACQKLP_03115 [Chitinophaga sp. NPDC101104]|uniref:hypothetical protein n=1 Tax=Chitinophaga sp. NPDC101104 TaxID=3390561 RepID=UPI003D06B6E0